MSFITDLEKLAKPTTVCAYIDKVQFWLFDPLDQATLSWLEKNCGRGRLHTETKHARWDPKYRQRVELRQPSTDALSWLATRNSDVFINRIELAIDWAFDNWWEQDETFEFFHRHLVRRHHGKKQEIWLISSTEPGRQEDIAQAETRYDGPRYAPNSIKYYKQPICRITGEIGPLIHMEWRGNSAKAVRSLGIESAQDLVNFNHRAFWAYRLLLRKISPGRLGRCIRNRQKAGKSRVDTPTDRRIGSVLTRSCVTLQQLLDKWGSRYPIRRILEPIPNDLWLPEPTNTISVIYPAKTTTHLFDDKRTLHPIG